MTDSDFDEYIRRFREAAVQEDAVKRIRAIMTDAVSVPDALAKDLGPFEGDDIILFEDETVSIQHCRFDPGLHVPPHDHQIAAVIGVYEGGEVNHFHVVSDGKLVRRSTKEVLPGDIISMGSDAIHSVEAASDGCGYAIHVYLGPLSTVERSLYDWETGAAYRYSREKYDELLRHS
jgi:predicted metal-dependent enzyme (double-stranded beta helix superfamily)